MPMILQNRPINPKFVPIHRPYLPHHLQGISHTFTLKCHPAVHYNYSTNISLRTSSLERLEFVGGNPFTGLLSATDSLNRNDRNHEKYNDNPSGREVTDADTTGIDCYFTLSSFTIFLCEPL